MDNKKTNYSMYFLLLFVVACQKNLVAMQKTPQAVYKQRKSSVKTIKRGQEALIKAEKEKRAEQAKTEAETQITKSKRLKKCFDLMMIIDDLEEETVTSKNTSAMLTLQASLQQKSFPILVSTNTIRITLERTNTFIGTDNYKKFFGIKDLFNDHWHCYDHPEGHIMLFIPKNYFNNFIDREEALATQLLEHYTPDMSKCGFDTSCMKKINNLSTPHLVDYFAHKSNQKNNLSIIQAIESIFSIPTKLNSPTWNIYLSGHGLPNERIAGLPIETFYELLQFFQKINCSLLYYGTCFGGGINLIHVTEELKRLHVNFMVIAQGINENIIEGLAAHLTAYKDRAGEFFKRAESFFGDQNAFILQKGQLGQKNPIAFLIKPLIDKQLIWTRELQPFIYIPSVGIFSAIDIVDDVKIITESSANAYAFENRAIDCANKTTIIVYPDYISAPMKIAFINQSTSIVSPSIPKFKKFDMHIFEEIIDESTPTHPHLSFKFNTQLLYSLFADNLKYHPVTFAIKKIFIPKKDIIYENVIAHCSGIDNKNQIRIDLLFTNNKKSYAIKTLLIDYSDSLLVGDLFGEGSWRTDLSANETQLKDISQDSYSNLAQHIPLYLRQLPAVASVLNSQEKQPSLAGVVEALESYTSKSTQVQELGSLKKILLKKQKSLATPNEK